MENTIAQEGKAEACTAAEEIVETTQPAIQTTTEPVTWSETQTTTNSTSQSETQIIAEHAAQSKTTTESQLSIENTTAPETQPAKKRGSDISITDSEYDYLCRIVMGEAGDESYDGQILVAQCLYNAMAESDKNAWDVKSAYGYCGSTSTTPTKSVKNAVAAVFYDGYRYTNEKVLYFYAPAYCSGSWHETQRFVCQVGGHRFFAKW